MTRFLSLLSVIALTGCMITDYVGVTHPPTSQVDLFFDEADVLREFVVMGELRVEGDNSMFMRSSKMQRKFLEKARERGADGVIFAPVTIRVTGETGHTSGTTEVDEEGRGWTSESTTATVQEVKELRGVLIKYEPHS